MSEQNNRMGVFEENGIGHSGGDGQDSGSSRREGREM